MEFQILGPLEVVHDGRLVTLGGGRERALLALLLLSANTVVSSDRLAEDLWAGRPPEGAHQALQVYVSRLRKSLRKGGGDGILVTRPPGYLAQVGTDELDAARFEALLAEGRAQAAAGDHRQAATRLKEALGLWRGPALADLADAPFARPAAARLEEARLAATEERIEADLACGRHGELIPELDALTRAHPLRERLWAQRMVALYRAGRQAEALRVYQELRGLLGQELGLEPSTALRRLEGAILRHDLAITARVLDDPDAALAHHRAAAGVIDSSGAARPRALNGYQWARTLLARDAPGDRSQAAALLQETLEYSRTKGYTFLVEKCEELLASTR